MFRLLRYVAVLSCLSVTHVAFSAVQCAGFSKSGAFAKAALNGNDLSLTISRDGVDEPSAPLKVDDANSCGVSFSADEALVAISLFRPGASGVQVAIFGSTRKSWVSGGAFTPKFARLSGGFVGESHNVATGFLSGEWQRGASVAAQIYAIDPVRRGIEAADLRPIKAPSTSIFENSMDSAHNRLWYRTPSGRCGIRSVAILGVEPSSWELPSELIPSCYEPSVFDFPTANRVVVGAQTAGKIQLWRVDFPDKHVIPLEIPDDRKNEFQLQRISAHSPDGKVVAIALRVFRRDKLGGLREGGYEIALVQVDPWRVIATVPVGSDAKSLGALAVDHRDGHAIIQAFGDDHWTQLQADVPR